MRICIRSLLAWVALAVLASAQPALAGSAEARLEQIDGTRVLVLRGDPYARGYEHGRLLAADIKYLIERYLNVGIVEHWQRPRARLEDAARRMERFIPLELREEMRGIADGAGVPYREVLLLNTHVDPTAYLTGGGSQGCSGAAVMGRWTSDGRVLHAHNVDWTTDEECQRGALLLVIIPAAGVPLCMPTHVGMVGCNAGINAAGITYSDMTSLSADQRLDGIPLMIMARLLLQNARTLDQALDLLRRHPQTCGWNMIITDAKGPDMRAIEVSATRLKIFRPGDPAEDTPTGAAALPEAVVRTNHYVDPEMFALACERFGFTVERGVAVVRQDSTYLRYRSLLDWIAADDLPVQPQDLQRWLGRPPVGGPGNLQSMVFDPANQRLWIANATPDGAPAWQTRYSRVSLKPYFSD